MKTLLEVLQAGTDYLARQGCDEARATMQHLLAHVLHCNRTALYSQFDRPVEEAELAPLRELLKRRAAGEPLQHLLGVTEFFRRDFLTDARALIPRPETEELVEMVLKKIPDHPVRILDMGTGSGVIGVTLALELKERAGEVVLADISPQALDLALENAMRLGARVSTIQTNLFANIPQEKTDPYAEATSDEQRYGFCGRLFDEYRAYNLDSSFVYAQRKEELAHRMDKLDYLDDAAMNMAEVMGTTGMYKEALELLGQIDKKTDAALLKPGEKVEYHKNKQTFTKSAISDMREIDFWRNNMLIFNSSSLAEIATTLERMYGVKVVFDSEKLKNVLFSGTIRNSSLHNVFYIISLTYPLTYELEGDTVRIGSSIN